MHLHFVDAFEKTLTVPVESQVEALALFQDAIQNDPWISATLRDNDGGFLASYQRLNGMVESHPSITPAAIKDALSVRSEARQGDLPGHGRDLWCITGYCHEVSEYLEQEYGLARTSGTIMAKDLITPICLHYWNVLPDLSILDMTADQLMEGHDFRIITTGHPDWFRYQPEYECLEDFEDMREEGFYSDELIDFIVATGNRIGDKRASMKEYLACMPADEPTKERLKPFVTEHLTIAVKEHEKYYGSKLKREEREQGYEP
jgi:hypothetical protein